MVLILAGGDSPAARLAKDCIKKVEVLEYQELGHPLPV
jgi:tartrate dehydratase beta subunit/fumarate hydratase class I family protein